jgi:phosphoribosylaminoimidazole-succinocarboxamide synthase
MLLELSRTYLEIAEKIVGHPIPLGEDPRAEIIATLRDEYDLID